MAENKKKKRELSKAALNPGLSVAQFVVQQLLNGLEVGLEIDGKPCVGYVHNLDYGKGSDFVFASVSVQDPDDKEESFYVRVSIHADGQVNIMPNQPDDD